jgi:polysaccharide export outer membrane protein
MLMLLLVAACGQSGPVLSSGDRYAANPAASGGGDSIDSYRLGAGDHVRLTVFNEPTLSGEFAVSSAGDISLPLIGNVPASGKTTREIGDDVQARLGNGYLRDPKVNMEVITFRPFFILGEVKAPGQYPYVTGLTVLNAVATAQGFTPRASKRIVYIRRNGASTELTYEVSPDLKVLPGDTVRFGERYF